LSQNYNKYLYISSEFITVKLIKKGQLSFLTLNKKEEEKKMTIMKSKNGKMEKPFLIVETKGYCKLVGQERACKHCSVEAYTKPGCSNGKVDWNEVIKQFAGLNGSGHVVLKNGAGALRETEVSLLEQALESGLSASVTTEGVCVPSDFESRLFELGQQYQGRLGVTVSLDGATKEVYSQLREESGFDKAVGFVKKAKAKGLDVAVNYVVHEGNVEQIKDYVDFVVNELGVKRVNFLELNLTGGARKNGLKVADPETYFKVLIDTYAEGNEKVKSALGGTFAAAVDKYLKGSNGCKGCPAGSYGMAQVNNRGDIFPCSSLELPQYRAGNIAEMSLSEAMGSEQFEKARKAAESVAEGNPVVSMCPGRLESFGELGQIDEATRLTGVITAYLKKKGVDVSEIRARDNTCYSPAF